jgi:hypothetical protein
MTTITYEEIVKSSDELVVGDEISVGGKNMRIEGITTNKVSDELFLYLREIARTPWFNSKMVLIIPKKKFFVNVLKEVTI